MKTDGEGLVKAGGLEMGRVFYGRALTEIHPKRSHLPRILRMVGDSAYDSSQNETCSIGCTHVQVEPNVIVNIQLSFDLRTSNFLLFNINL